ncbi:MAG TPA: DUF6249 domain-containing protein [Terracidiphilus sp.]|nr:DUF6249 domain-containing protein [Terracidiphilus sp.]
MTHLATLFFGNPDLTNMGMWIFLSIGAVALFVVFIPTVTWLDNRRKEREAFYKAETIRRVAEASGECAKATIDLLREESRLERLKKREGMKISGLINVGLGIGIFIFLWFFMGPKMAYCGLIPGLIGVAMLVYVLFLAAPVE